MQTTFHKLTAVVSAKKSKALALKKSGHIILASRLPKICNTRTSIQRKPGLSEVWHPYQPC